MAEGRTVARWSLQEKLGTGGNADVWRATDSDGREVALKVVHSTKLTREPYRRFVREIETLRALPDEHGVLPILDAYLPDRPSSTDRAWLAMPVAQPITDALSGQPLEVVVGAVAEIAETLARLHSVNGLAHRDLKPGNLYRLRHAWLVGDFGLVAVPNVEDVTQTGRPLGPAHYTPYEMLAGPASADPMLSDVYSLAKTLWVLTTDQRFPPEGHQPAGIRGFSIGDFRHHPNAHVLDDLIDRSTRIHPTDRPSMTAFAAELRSWLGLPPETKVVDIGEIRERFRAKMRSQLDLDDKAEQRREFAHKAIRRLSSLVAPLNQALRDLHPRATVDGGADEFMRNVLRTRDETFGSPDIALRYQRLSSIAVGDRPRTFLLRFGRTVELTDAGQLIVHMFFDVGYQTLGGSAFHWMPQPWSAEVGTVEGEEMLRNAAREAAEQLPRAAEAFTEGVPEISP